MINMGIDKLIETPPYALDKNQKSQALLQYLIDLTNWHYENSTAYHRILDASGYAVSDVHSIEDIPFIPVSLFKDYELLSVDKDSIKKTMTSSGTTGQKVSKVFLDAETLNNQRRVLAKIIASYIGPSRLPLLILDSELAIKDRALFSARGAGIMGFSVFGRDITYALNHDMTLNIDAVTAFLTKHRETPILLFGYTFMIWQHFFKELAASDITLDFGKEATLFHVGGWKKLKDQAVDADSFKKSLAKQCGILRVHDYYGMAEQLGSIFVACEYGHLHSSIFSEIVVRRHIDFSPCDIGELGIIQVISAIPHSYPGHSLLTEDEGVILGEDDCPCGRKGKYFKINGRLKNAEIRGCSDTYAAKF